MNSYKETVQSFIIDNFLFGDDKRLKDDTSFLESGIIDSTGILELITFIEQTYHITVEDTELVPENLDSLLNIEKFLSKKTKSELVN